MYEVGTGWLIFTLYMVLFLLFFDLLKLCSISFNQNFMTSLLATFVLLGYGYYNYRHPKINTVNITLTKPLTDNRRPIKIVAVSDIHLGNGTGKTSLKQYVKMINEQNPDLILIGGDLIDNSVIPLYAENMAEELTELKAPLGIYMVPGNHEYISGIDKSIQFIQNTPIQLLRDSVVTLPCGIQLIGRDDRSNARRLPLQKLMARIDKSKPVILLDHQPYQLAESQAAGIDLQFSGHTHHGHAADADYDVDSVLNDSALADCTAVKEGHIAQIPSDIEALDSPVPASFLGSYYVASILHPDVVTEDDFKTTEKNFYETFYGFTPESAN